MSSSGSAMSARLPRKRFYRARAHSNPLSDSHFPIPLSPAHVDYSAHFPHLDYAADAPKVRFADVGCGFGGLLVSLSPLFPDTLMIGMELRDKAGVSSLLFPTPITHSFPFMYVHHLTSCMQVTEYVKDRIQGLRATNPGHYNNISVVRTNSMKYIPNYFHKAQLSKMFFLFPDPHFKEKNHRRRVLSLHLLDEYAYVMQLGGIIYTVTDVEELGEWMASCLEKHPLFEAVGEEEIRKDPVVKLLTSATEEGQKVARNEGQTFMAIYRRVASKED